MNTQTTGTYEGRTAEQWREAAAACARRSQESWERSDTDGFLSQWASDSTNRLNLVKAELADSNGLSEFPALFDLDGNLVAAKLLDTRYGSAWALLDSDDPDSRIVGWVNRSKAAKAKTRAANLAKKGYTEGTVVAPAGAKLTGTTTLSVWVYRKDGGFSRDAEVVSATGHDTYDWA